MQNTKDVLRQVKKIEIVTKNLVDGIIAGNYRSIFKGQGIEFSEIRDYRVGDDIRSIDWKVTARFNHPFIKEFIEDRDLNVYFVFDCSASGNFGNFVEKRSRAVELVATLMFSAVRNSDNVGMFLFTDNVEKYVPAKKGRRHVLKLIDLLISHKPVNKKTDIGKSLSSISHVIKKRSVVFVVSDFYNPDFVKSLKILRGRHDVVAIKTNDSREFDIPDVGLIELEDEETGEQILVDTSDADFRENYSRIMRNEEARLKRLFGRNGVDMIKIRTDGSYEKSLKKFFKIRQMRGIL